ncbi:MAG: hypothetical protein HC848_04165 [Limnobacter sp.]|nr:hypothetical protein [Limnobacter sp.]
MTTQIDLSSEKITQADWLTPSLHPLACLNVAQVRDIEHTAFAQIDSFLLMHAAGARAAQQIRQGQSAGQPTHYMVLAGPGNNGGDAFVVASMLHQAHESVVVYDFAMGKPGSPDRQQALALLQKSGLKTRPAAEFALPQSHCVVVDGLLGLGARPDLPPDMQRVIGLVNQANQKTRVQHKGSPHLAHPVHVVALDCPTGLNCDTGIATPGTLQANLTLSFIAAKQGFFCNQRA